jgi:hypothetical protein
VDANEHFKLRFTEAYFRNRKTWLQRLFGRFAETSYHAYVVGDPEFGPFDPNADSYSYSYKVKLTGFRVKFLCLTLDFKDVPFEYITSLGS